MSFSKNSYSPFHLAFISYVNRSGSTFLANQLSKFDEVLVFPEAEALDIYLKYSDKIYEGKTKENDLLSYFLKYDRKLKLWGITFEELHLEKGITYFDIFIEILNTYHRKQKPNAKLFVFKGDKLLYYRSNIPSRYKKTYHLKYLILIRDIRGIFASQQRTIGGFSGKPMNYNPYKLVKEWNRYSKNVILTKKDAKSQTIFYEKLMQNFMSEFNEIVSFLGINNLRQQSKGDLFHRIPIVQHDMHRNIHCPPDSSKISQWEKELGLHQIYLLEKYAEKYLTLFTYPLKYQIHKRKYIYYILHCKVDFLFFKFRRFIRNIIVKLIYRIKNIQTHFSYN